MVRSRTYPSIIYVIQPGSKFIIHHPSVKIWRCAISLYRVDPTYIDLGRTIDSLMTYRDIWSCAHGVCIDIWVTRAP